MKINKLTAVLLCLIIFALTLSACSSSTTTTETESESTTAEIETSIEDETATPKTESASEKQSEVKMETILVSVTVDCLDAVNYGYEAAINVAEDGIIYDDSVEVEEGDTVLDALKSTGLVVAVEDSEYGSYVTSISSLAQGDCGSSSGWTFTVNGESPSVSADQVSVSDGDEVSWTLYCVEGE